MPDRASGWKKNKRRLSLFHVQSAIFSLRYVTDTFSDDRMNNLATESEHGKRAGWILVAGLVGILLMWTTGFTIGRSSDLALLLGRFHPSLVHFPIGILVFAIALDGWSRFRSEKMLEQGVVLAFLVGTWATILSVAVGLHLETGGGYDLSTIRLHKIFGFSLAALGTLAYLMKSGFFQGHKNSKSFSGVAAGILICIILGGHFGGDMTYQEGYLTRYAPDGVRNLMGLPPKKDLGKISLSDPSAAGVYAVLVDPIFQHRCVTCHNSKTHEGGLSLENSTDILAGGKDGEVVVSGRSDRSELVRRIWLPLNHADHMPPESRRQVTIAEAALIRWWIDQGASFEQEIGEASITPEIEAILEGLSIGDIRHGIFAIDVFDPDSTELTTLTRSGLRVSRLSETENYLHVICPRASSCLTAEATDAMEAISQNIAWLDLGESVVSSTSLSFISRLTHMTRLHLDQTDVSDEALDYVGELQFLEYLNLYGTSITDEGLTRLEGIESLRSLFIWQTHTTAQGIERLQRALPNLDINTGQSSN
ncbi:MAG: hypothetical protein E2O85_00020 [Bacteroidetes bacterium]|nr:MAG: hypothetical protein E2O85_00020 [Bacteroidota bacterium]